MLKVSEKTKNSLVAAAWDTLDVILYTGIPAGLTTGAISAYFDQIPELVQFAPLIASAINIVWYYLRRFRDYQTGKRTLPDFML